MKIKNQCSKGFIFLLLFLCLASAFAQSKKKPVAHTKPNPTQKKSSSTQQIKKFTPPAPLFQNQSIVNFTTGQLDTFQMESAQMVNFFQGMLNFLADGSNSVKEKQTIITQSNQKIFWDPKVQIEDDLDQNRAVSLYKDVPAYLSDVSFFFAGAKFLYTVQNVSVMSTPAGQTYFKVTANRNLKGVTVNGDSVNWNRVRYLEINYNDSLQQLKIVSIYTTKLNERDDMRIWWNGLSDQWKTILGKGVMISDTLPLSHVGSFKDSLAMVYVKAVKIDSNKLYNSILAIINKKSIDLSGSETVSNLNPLSKLSSLISVNISNTQINDLTPLRNLNNLEELDISGTLVSSLAPLKYATKIKSLKMAKTLINDLSLVSGFTSLEILDISQTPNDNMVSVKDLINLHDLRFSGIKVSDLKPLSGLTNIELLYFTKTPVTDLSPLKSLSKLQVLFCDDSKVKDLNPVGGLPDLKRIYCDNTGVDRQMASQFMQKYPEILVIYASDELNKWWSTLPVEWKNVFSFYSKLDNSPTTEQLHRLSMIDSIDIKGRTSVTSLEPIKMLKQLKKLDCANSGISDLSPLTGITDLIFLNFSNTKVTSVDPVRNSKNLEFLYMDNTQVNNIKALYGLKMIKYIYADNTGVNLTDANLFLDSNQESLIIFQTYENTSWWKNMPEEWKQVFLNQMKIIGIPDKIQLQQIANLEKLSVSENDKITSLQPVIHLTRLKELSCSDTRITDLQALSAMKQLKAIRITKNPLADLTPLGSLTGLKELDVSNTQVEELEPIQNLTDLEILKISGTQIKNLKYLARMNKLKVVEMYNTRVSNLDVFETMNQLTSLKIFNTKISEKKVAKFKTTHPNCEVVFY